jgi:hypothetical protein
MTYAKFPIQPQAMANHGNTAVDLCELKILTHFRTQNSCLRLLGTMRISKSLRHPRNFIILFFQAILCALSHKTTRRDTCAPELTPEQLPDWFKRHNPVADHFDYGNQRCPQQHAPDAPKPSEKKQSNKQHCCVHARKAAL